MKLLIHSIAVAILAFGSSSAAGAVDLPEWTQQIRADHPRLFFNAQSWPQVRERALTAKREWYEQIRGQVDRRLNPGRERLGAAEEDLGIEAAQAAFVFLVTRDARYLDRAKRCLSTSLDFYDECFRQRKAVNWYSISRVHAILAWDWLYNDLDDATRRAYLSRLIQAIDRVLEARPRIFRENLSGFSTGFYGVQNCLWFLGCTAFQTGIETEKVNEWLVWGRAENLKLLEHRRQACGDDGGGASATLGYLLGAYPWAEQNFFYTWLSSTGENIAPDWPHSAWLANYVLWQWIAAEPAPLEFGYGDTPHTSNRLPIHQLSSHLSNIRHLYGQEAPQAAALARYVQSRLPAQTGSPTWFIYPFLWSDLERSPAPFVPEALPKARHFDNMGQVVMRSGVRAEDTYCLFSCGGTLTQHRHYDALNFVIYHGGFLALDSGTRYDELVNGEHLANYYAQTVAHNCVVIHQPGEPPARYWGGTVTGNHGGQHSATGSVVRAFESGDEYVYVAGDATACYQHPPAKDRTGAVLGQKATQVTRQLVFIPPQHFVIFDRVRATNPSYRKDWLLHTAHEPSIQDRTFRADHGQGRMFCQTLLPSDAKLAKVGGPGREFWAAGTNWSLQAKRLSPSERAMMGQWRVEITPGQARKDDLFLHVIQVGRQDLAAMSPVTRVERDGRIGARIEIGADTWQVMFNPTGALGGHIARIGPRENLDRQLTDRVQRQVGILARTYSSMTLDEARARVPKRTLPDFWVGDLNGLAGRLGKLQTADVKVIARSPGGRPVHRVAFGELETLPSKANFNSAIGARDPSAYRNKPARKKPVILFVGPVHGHEVEALTGLANLMEIIETGRDLRGRDQSALQALGRQCRLVIIPMGNPDGTARFEPRALHGLSEDDVRFWGQGTWSDGTLCGWPDSKSQHPMAGNNVGFLGCYFNERGINPMHDEFFAPMSTEAPAILDVAREEAPDLAVSLHSHSAPPALLRPAYVPIEIQEAVLDVAQRCYALMDQRGLPHGRPFAAEAERGRDPAAFNLTSALHHVSGAVSFTFECPHGLSSATACNATLEQILDMQLSLYEAMIRFALDLKPR
ncbi:MAG TPA: heparinase II/III family protein [Candidatus Paceibacterota bacterium]|nr:heparinase II/III family protein [Verrucomicrobiota bacterium]HOX03807.1 heparinase II/III family protein [Verrucomicrobiota bacterium]HRZ44355.1 heparinase II/III family protein [Candidatus Paceibacterota bacterium]HRZ92428.1 heparinase II/III family protein [Candidatus Paceibacterota bacterium]